MRAIELLERKLDEGGNAFPDVGTIHLSEIKPTLKYIAKLLGIPQAADQALGSVGKKEYSGDIDIALDLDPGKMKLLSLQLRKKLGNQNVTGVAGNVSIRIPIQKYDETKQDRQPRTGHVQVDLIPGEPGWMKTFYHSPSSKESKLKGVHRNLALTTLAKHVDTDATKEVDDQGRPIRADRWAWGPKGGLQRVRKTSKWNDQTNRWTKNQDTEILSDPIFNPARIADVFFRGRVGPDALNSAESVIEAIKKAYSEDEQNAIFADIADLYSRQGIVDGFEMPAEIKRYL